LTELHLQEGGPELVCHLREGLAERLVEAGVVSVVPLGVGRWELRANQKVGVIRIDNVTVWVKPKVSISKLLWLLGWSSKAFFTAPGPVELGEAEELVPALAEAFVAQSERALQAGLLQGYREIEGTENVLRGRLRIGDQLRKRYGLPVPLLVRFDDHLVDIPENQILKAAVNKLLMLSGVAGGVRDRLRTLRGVLVDVGELPPRGPLPTWQRSRLNARHHDALALAEIILGNGSVEHEPGRLRVDGFLVDLAKVFENFVTATLGRALEAIAGRCSAQDPFTLDEDGDVAIRPDLVWRISDRPAAAIDAKYKAEKPYGFPQADLYQALAYATAYGLHEAHLVYAKGNETARAWTIRGHRVRITAHTLDLEQPPESILQQIDQLAALIASISRASRLANSRPAPAFFRTAVGGGLVTLSLVAGPLLSAPFGEKAL